MTILYKLTDRQNRTRPHEDNECVWGPGVSHAGTGKGGLCGPGWVHAYLSPELAAFLNPIHAGFGEPKLWLAEGDVAQDDHGLKVGCRRLTTVRELPLPVLTTEVRVRVAVLATRTVYHEPVWTAWACGWLDGDRSLEKAQAAEAAAAAATKEGRSWAVDAAMCAAAAAVDAAMCAAMCAAAAEAVDAAMCAAAAAEAAEKAMKAAGLKGAVSLSLTALVREAIKAESGE